jgi:homoserine dehydrogenase
MNLRAQQRLRKAVVSMLSQTASGKSAAQVLKDVVNREKANPEDVRRQIRALLESGEVVVGPDLNLLARHSRRLRKAG